MQPGSSAVAGMILAEFFLKKKTGRCAEPVSPHCELLLLPHSLERNHLAPALLWRFGRLRFRPGCGRFHKAADLLRRTSLHIIGEVGIGVQGKSGAVVAQHAGQRFHIHAAGEGHGGEGVAQIVEAHMFLDAGLFQQLAVDPAPGAPPPAGTAPPCGWSSGS